MKRCTTVTTPILVLLIAGLLSACIVPIGPGSRFYLLNAMPPDTRSPHSLPAGLLVEISQLELPAYLDRPQLVTRATRQELVLQEEDHWAGDLAENIKRVLAKNLSLLLRTPEVAVVPHNYPQAPDYRLRVQILQFERGADQRVTLAARWQVSAGSERRQVAARLSEFSSAAVSNGPSLNSTVVAMGQLLGKLSDEISDVIAVDASSGPAP